MFYEYQAKYDQDGIADALRQIYLPAGIVVLFVPDSADEPKSGRYDMASDHIYDHYRLRLIEQGSGECSEIEKNETYKQDPLASDHVIRMSKIVDDKTQTSVSEHKADAYRDKQKCFFRYEHQDQRTLDRKISGDYIEYPSCPCHDRCLLLSLTSFK
jgi:hypothetical protein